MLPHTGRRCFEDVERCDAARKIDSVAALGAESERKGVRCRAFLKTQPIEHVRVPSILNAFPSAGRKPGFHRFGRR